jgi:hypothetical protein
LDNLGLVTKYYVESVLGHSFDSRRIIVALGSDGVPFIENWDEGLYGAKPDVATVMSHEAAWQAAKDATAYAAARRKEYREAFTLEEELEAMREALRGNTTKFDAQNATVDAIKAANPKPA